MTKIFELIPDGKVTISVKWIGVILLAVVSLSIGYGQYKSDTAQIQQDRQDLHTAINAINDLRIEMTDLKRTVSDLKDALEHEAEFQASHYQSNQR